MPRVKMPAVLVCLMVLCSMMALPSQAHAATFEGRDLIYRKHVDAVHIVWTGSGLDIKVREGESTIRDAKDVAIRLGPDADQDGYEVSRFRVPEDKAYAFMGKPGDIVWLAPQQHYDGWAPVWAGIGHGELPDAVKKNLRLTLVDDGGPGKVELYRTIGLAGKPERELSSTDENLRTYEPGSHGHYSWIFTKPGVYRMKWKATATLADGKKVESPVVTVPWLVGSDEQVGLPEGTTKGAPIKHPVDGAPADEDEPAPGEPSPDQPSPEPPTENPPADHPFARNSTKELPNCTPISSGHLDISTVLKDEGGLWMRSRLDTASGKETLPWNGAVLEVPNSAKQQIPDGTPAADLRAALGTAEAWELPESQNKALPWPGFSTEGLDYANIEKLTYQVESWEGPDGGAWAIGGFNPARGKFVVQVDSAKHASKMKSWQRVTTLPVTFAVSDDAVAFTCDRNGKGLESPGGDSPTPTDPAKPDDEAKPEEPDSGEAAPEDSAGDEAATEESGADEAASEGSDAGELPAEGAAPDLPSTGV